MRRGPHNEEHRSLHIVSSPLPLAGMPVPERMDRPSQMFFGMRVAPLHPTKHQHRTCTGAPRHRPHAQDPTGSHHPPDPHRTHGNVRFPPVNVAAACQAGTVIEDPVRCYQAAQSKDARFDDQFFCAVTSTGIYCRPSCPARTPKAREHALLRHRGGGPAGWLPACLRCRPDATPGSPEWNVRADVVARAMRLIRDGVVDREGVEGLAGRLGYSTRQLNRLITAEVGTGPLALARAQRSQTARVLLETTDLPVAHVAFAAGFASVRQCNDTVRQTFADTPSGLRPRAARTALGRRYKREPPPRRSGSASPAGSPSTPRRCSTSSASRAARRRGARRRVLHAQPAAPPRARDRHAARARGQRRGRGTPARPTWKASSSFRTCATCRPRWRAAASCSTSMPTLSPSGRPSGATRSLGALVRRDPGRRVPGAADGFELAVRAVIGQQARSRARALWPGGWCWPPAIPCRHRSAP